VGDGFADLKGLEDLLKETNFLIPHCRIVGLKKYITSDKIWLSSSLNVSQDALLEDGENSGNVSAYNTF
jgi:hypothetical protein